MANRHCSSQQQNAAATCSIVLLTTASVSLSRGEEEEEAVVCGASSQLPRPDEMFVERRSDEVGGVRNANRGPNSHRKVSK